MERDFYHSDFEELIREKAEQYKMYPSEKVWRNVNNALRTRRRWYWTGFVLLLSGVSYFAVTDLINGSPAQPKAKVTVEAPKTQVTTAELVPFTRNITSGDGDDASALQNDITPELYLEDGGNITASFQIPLKLFPGNESAKPEEKAELLISGLKPLAQSEFYDIELSLPQTANEPKPADKVEQPISRHPFALASSTRKSGGTRHQINWFEEMPDFKKVSAPLKRISWQLAFSPTINYRKLTGGPGSKGITRNPVVPMAIHVEGDIDKLVNHKPALGFELGTHAFLRLNNRIAVKGGIQFNYSKYDIRAFRTSREPATIALNSQVPGTIVNYTDLRNFGGTSVEDLKNQYFQLSMPVGVEVRVFGKDRLQFNVASTIQPTYLMNRNTYLITTDLKNYTQEPSLVRRWNVNAGAEAYISYTRGDVKWQVGPQFRYQLLSSYQNVYPIKEYLMEYGIKVGITKTIR